jgi:hypothetical protein
VTQKQSRLHTYHPGYLDSDGIRERPEPDTCRRGEDVVDSGLLLQETFEMGRPALPRHDESGFGQLRAALWAVSATRRAMTLTQ